MFSGGGITKSDESSDKPTDPTHCNFPEYSKLKGEHNTSLNRNSGTFYSSLLEMSVPVDVGDAGIDSAMFNSRKIAYRDLVKNIIIDTKAYLNRRNNLGEFNLCALAYANYEYKGHKKFLSGPDEGKADGDYSDRGVDI